MAWRAITTQRGPEGYCGMAGRPPAVDEAINKQTIAGLIERASDLAALLNEAAGRRLLVPH